MDQVAINTENAAKRVGLSASSLEKARVNGTGPKYIKLGRSVRYRVTDLDEWVACRVVSSTSETAMPLNATLFASRERTSDSLPKWGGSRLRS